MILKMLVEAEIPGHSHAMNDGHPRPVIIATFWHGFPGLENDEKCLESTQSRDVHEGIRMLCAT
jgi:hypothetical protein